MLTIQDKLSADVKAYEHHRKMMSEMDERIDREARELLSELRKVKGWECMIKKCEEHYAKCPDEFFDWCSVTHTDDAVQFVKGYSDDREYEVLEISFRKSLKDQVRARMDYLAEQCEKENEKNQMWVQELTERNKFWNDFIEYITKNAVGDKLALIRTVHDNRHNRSEGYVKVQKRINEKKELLFDFTTSKGDKRTAIWQPSDNYACWQTCGIASDDYSGFLLMPTYKDDEYFCIYYEC